MGQLRQSISRVQSHSLALPFVIAVGYIVGLIAGWGTLSPLVLVVTLAMLLIYALLIDRSDLYFARRPPAWSVLIYFLIVLALPATVIALLGPGAWLIMLPVASVAAQHLPSGPRWLVYLAMLAALAFPFLREGEYTQAFFFTLTFSPAILFVVGFTQLLTAEQTERRKAEALAAELEEANHLLADYAQQVDELARAQERNRMAREIHDSLGHYLTVANIQIRAAAAVMAADPERARDALDKAQHLTQEGLGAVRESVAALRESPLGDRSLPNALQALLDEAAVQGLAVNLVVEGPERPLDPRAELTFYRAAQEGLTNARKHARASHISLKLDYSAAGTTSLTIEDNGVGAASLDSGGFGLLGIEERAGLLGGTVKVTTAPGSGFCLQVTLPVEAGRIAPGEVP